MDIENVRHYCINLPEVTESFPFDDTTLVFKVAGKMFALLNLKENHSVNLKCNPEKAIDLRDRYESVLPGYHMNKTHWNTILLNGLLPDGLIIEWIVDSYNLIVEKLPKKLNVKMLDGK